MNISNKMKQRFCKDCNIPINIFNEPYFTDRLKFYDKFYDTIVKYDIFLNELKQYNCEQDYFEEYNRVKDNAICDIKNSEAYQIFNNEDMDKFSVTHKNLPNSDIFKVTHDNKMFISVDMRKANFSSLKYYNPAIFDNADTWEEFIGKYTKNTHIINSKYIRQVILGNCNPKRHVTYEKYLMESVLNIVIDKITDIDNIVFFSNDEIVIKLSDDDVDHQCMVNKIYECTKNINIPLKVELFKLHKITGIDGYYKEIIKDNDEKEIEFKCINNYMLPFVIKKFLKEEITENDKVFYYEGLLSKFIEIPEISLNYDV